MIPRRYFLSLRIPEMHLPHMQQRQGLWIEFNKVAMLEEPEPWLRADKHVDETMEECCMRGM